MNFHLEKKLTLELELSAEEENSLSNTVIMLDDLDDKIILYTCNKKCLADFVEWAYEGDLMTFLIELDNTPKEVEYIMCEYLKQYVEQYE